MPESLTPTAGKTQLRDARRRSRWPISTATAAPTLASILPLESRAGSRPELSSAAQMQTAILMPAYNEAAALARTLRALADFAATVGPSIALTIFLVDDGSDVPIDIDALARDLRIV